MLVAALIIGAIGATAGFAIWHGRKSALDEHQRSMNSMGIVLAEHTSRYVQVIDMVVRQVQLRIATLNVPTPADFSARLDNQDMHQYLVERLKNVPQLEAVLLVDANGRLVNASRQWPSPHNDLSDRDYFKHVKEHDDEGLFVGALSKSRGTGNLSLFFAHRISGPDGAFWGLVVGVVDIRSLSAFYESASAYLGQSVTLLRRDGTMLMRYPDPERSIGAKLPPTSPWFRHVTEGGSTYLTPVVLDGFPSLISVHVLPDYPLVVNVAMKQADVYVQWRREAVLIAGFALTASVAFTGLFWMLARQVRRQAAQNIRLDAVLDNITQGICFFDGDKRLLLWNRRYVDIYDLPPESIHAGCSLKTVIELRHAAGSTPAMSTADYVAWQERSAIANQAWQTIVPLRNGRTIAMNYQPMPDRGWVATHEDITERQQAAANIAFMAHHDALTRLPNRVLFRERMEQAIAMAGRGGKFAVICLDLDKFKQVNDSFGHPVGDGLLVAVADRLQACAREGDTVARLGGDEFAIIQFAIQHVDDAEAMIGRILAAFEQPFIIEEHQVMSGTSIGVTVAPNDGSSYETLMRDADIALYLAKTEGRGTARFFEPEMDARIHLRRKLERDLQAAIDHHEFALYYQPQVNLTSDKISGFEALLRWHHPERGLVSPVDFIPVAEETGMIGAIGEWALRTACLEAKNWPADLSVAVNLSPVQFRKGNLVGVVQAALLASGLPPNRLELEITESVFLQDTAGTLAALRQLGAMGICVALDDFGTGYSSLSYLRSFPFNKIKIDKSFVQDVMTNKESMSIVRAVTGLGQSLGIRITAEGVETLEQLNRLRENDCTEAQGYFFSPPRPAAAIPAMIARVRHVAEEMGSCDI